MFDTLLITLNLKTFTIYRTGNVANIVCSVMKIHFVLMIPWNIVSILFGDKIFFKGMLV